MRPVIEVFDSLFNSPRDARSDAYKRGVMAGLNWEMRRIKIHMPYAPGSAERDAFWSGLDEGKREGHEVMRAEGAQA